MNKRTTNRGFTLIEGLISIAIISIMSAALLAPIVAPAQEEKVAARDFYIEGQYANFFAAMLEDAHSASAAEVSSDGSRILFSRRSGRGAIYALDESNSVRRWELESVSAALLDGDLPTEAVSPMFTSVSLFAPRLEEDGRSISIGIGILNPRPKRMNEPPRSATFSIGFPKGATE